MEAFCNTPGDFHMEKTALPHHFWANEKQRKSFEFIECLIQKQELLKRRVVCFPSAKRFYSVILKETEESFIFLQEWCIKPNVPREEVLCLS